MSERETEPTDEERARATVATCSYIDGGACVACITAALRAVREPLLARIAEVERERDGAQMQEEATLATLFNTRERLTTVRAAGRAEMREEAAEVAESRSGSGIILSASWQEQANEARKRIAAAIRRLP